MYTFYSKLFVKGVGKWHIHQNYQKGNPEFYGVLPGEWENRW